MVNLLARKLFTSEFLEKLVSKTINQSFPVLTGCLLSLLAGVKCTPLKLIED